MSYASMVAGSGTRFDVERAVDVSDGKGGYTRTWSVIHRNIRFRLNQLASNETMLMYDKQTVFAQFVAYGEYLSDIKEGDRLSRGGLKYEIKLVMEWDLMKNQLKLAVMQVSR
jgi:head-tail adaptor